MNSLKEFYGPNAGYVLELYDRFLHDPASVDVQTRRLFESFPPKREERPEVESERIEPGQPSATVVSDNWKIAVVRLAQSIRQFGHLAARLDPLGLLSSEGASQQNVMKRDLVTQYGLDDETLRRLPSDLIGDSIASRTKNALEAIKILTKIYTSTIGFDFEHVHAAEERNWLRDAIETKTFAPPSMPIDEKFLLARLTKTETFEQFLQRSFPGKFRFSIEGIDMLVPMLDELVTLATNSSIKSIIIGMAHRGRLNVLTHILRVPLEAIFAEFKDPARHKNSRADLDWTGDVKYHRGALRIQKDGSPEADGDFSRIESESS